MIIRAALGNGFTDASAASRPSARRGAGAAPEVEDQAWFFDTELLVAAERHGYRIHEVPSTGSTTPTRVWTSRAPPWRTCGHLAAPQALARLTPSGTGIARRLSLDSQLGSSRELDSEHPRLLALVRALNGPLGAYGANAVALVICTLGNTAAHRWITFANQGRLGVRAALAGIAAVLATSLVFTMAGLAIANLLARVPSASRSSPCWSPPALPPSCASCSCEPGCSAPPARTAHERHHGEGSPPVEHNHRRASASPADRRPRRFAAVVALVVRPGRPAWSLPARAAIGLLALVSTPGALAQRRGNTFYARGEERTESPKAFFFGSLDPASFITVDKPRLAVADGAVARISVLLVEPARPQALCGWPACWPLCVVRRGGRGGAVFGAWPWR